MHRKHSNNAGFTVVEALLILIFLAIVGFAGYYVWHGQHNDTKDASATKTSGKQASTNSSSQANDENTQKKYLVIKEWGVKLPVDSSDISYYPTSGDNSNPTSVDFVSDKVRSTCGSAQDMETLLTVTRDDNSAYAGGANHDSIATVKAGGHTYYIFGLASPDSNGCKSDASRAVFNRTYNVLLGALKQMVAE